MVSAKAESEEGGELTTLPEVGYDPGMSDRATGGCLCGRVKYETTRPLEDVLQCHCENCRRLTGNFVAGVRTNTEDLQIESRDDAFQWYDLEYARYGFCQGCGSTIFYQAADRRDTTSVMVGTLDDASRLQLHEVWFADEAQPQNTLPDGVPQFHGDGAGQDGLQTAAGRESASESHRSHGRSRGTARLPTTRRVAQ